MEEPATGTARRDPYGVQGELAVRRAEAVALGETLQATRVRLAENRAQAKEIRARIGASRARRKDFGLTLEEDDEPLLVARQATLEMEHHRVALARLADERAAAVRRALARGLSRSEVARRLGVSPQAITKLLSRGRPLSSTE